MSGVISVKVDGLWEDLVLGWLGDVLLAPTDHWYTSCFFVTVIKQLKEALKRREFILAQGSAWWESMME